LLKKNFQEDYFMCLLRSARLLLLALFVSLVPASSFAGVFISVGFAPPVLPVYVQPVCPTPGLMWTPGYWAYGDDGYYWVPGAWVPSPYVGALWTPGYWGWSGGLYAWHGGYWGPHVGYYGGVNYGFGYGGIGFAGGMWRGGVFAYNTAVVHVGIGGGWGGNRVYEDRTIVNNTTIINNNHVSYNGGPGGVNHQPTPEENTAMHEQHTAPTSAQVQHESSFRSNPQSYAKNNGGHPQNAALSRPLNESRPANNANRGAMNSENHPGTQPANRSNGGQPNNQARQSYQPQSHQQPAAHPQEARPAPAEHNSGGSKPKSEPKPREEKGGGHEGHGR
jgi:hypothetical protein